MSNFNNLKTQYEQNGYFVIKKFFDQNFISEILEEITNAKQTTKYFDNNKNLRRIEKLFDKGDKLNVLNQKLIKLLKNIFNESFLIFKDKFNAKPPGGEGFFAHFDGIFHFIDENNIKRNGWYEYGNNFINILVALDPCTKQNGTLELSKSHKGGFEELLKKTKNDGTPALRKEIEDKIDFEIIEMEIGDIVIFSNTCPHRSKKNDTNKNRRIIYYTYLASINGSKYESYFKDKEKSKNKSKALVDLK